RARRRAVGRRGRHSEASGGQHADRRSPRVPRRSDGPAPSGTVERRSHRVRRRLRRPVPAGGGRGAGGSIVRRSRSARVLVAVAAALLVASACSLPGRTTGPLTITATFKDVCDPAANHSAQVADVRVDPITKIEPTPDFRAKVPTTAKYVKLRHYAVTVSRRTPRPAEK